MNSAVKFTSEQKKKIRVYIVELLLLMLAAVFAIIAFSKGAKAWFSNNKDVDTNGVGINIEEDKMIGIVDIKAYKMDKELDQVIEYDDLLTKTPEELGQILTLNKYDAVFTENNTDLIVILRVELENILGNSIDVTLNVLDNTDYINGDVLEADISNFLNVYCIQDTVLDGYYEDATSESFYNNAKNYFEAAASQGFVNYSVSGSIVTYESKSESIEYNIPKTQEMAENNNTAVLYICLDYNQTLISDYADKSDLIVSFGSEDFDWENNAIKFTPDIEKILFSNNFTDND